MKHHMKSLLSPPRQLLLLCLTLICFTACGSSDDSVIVTEDTAPYGWITGEVTYGTDSVDKSNVQGTIITLITIPEDSDNLKNTDVELRSYTAIADSKGKYLVKVPAGNYTLVAEGPGSTKAFAKVGVAKDETVSQNFTLTATATLKGQIDHPDFGYGTYVKIKDTQLMTKCDANGEFMLNDLPIGTYIFLVYNYPEDYYIKGAFSATLVPGLNEIGTISDLSLVPEIIYVSAKNNDTLCHSELHDFGISFSTEMNIEATEQAITLSAGSDIEPLVFEWHEYYPHLKITNLGELLKDYYGPVDLLISTDAVSYQGKPLVKPFSIRFDISEKIMQTIPEDGYQFAYLENPETESGLSEVKIIFSDAISPETFQYSIDPPLTGDSQVVWQREGDIDNNVAVIQGNFAKNTDYTVTITNAVTTGGIDIAGLPHGFSFKTTNLNVVSTHPYNGDEGVSPDTDISLWFNSQMNRQSVRDTLVIRDTLTNETITPSRLTWNTQNNPWRSHVDRLEIEFDSAYGKTYSIEIPGAESLNQVALEHFQLEFSTTTPKVSATDYDPYLNIINISFNTPVNWKKSDFSIVSTHDNVPVSFKFCSSNGDIYNSEQGKTRYIYIKPVEALSPESEYQVTWNGLEAITDRGISFSIEGGQFTFVTSPLHLYATNPASGSTDVSINKHSVTFVFSGLVPDTVKTDIESLLTVQSVKEGNRDTVTPTLFWDDSDYTNSLLFVDFVFDFDTTYTLSVDTSSSPVLSKIFQNLNPVTFSTHPVPDAGNSPDVFKRFNIEDHGVIDWRYNGWEITAEFNKLVDLRTFPANEIVEVRDSNGTLMDYSGNVSARGSTTIGGRVYSDSWEISQLPLSHGKTYSITLTDKIGVYDNGTGYTNNLPATITVTAKSPSISVFANNEEGLLTIRNNSGFYFSVSDVKNAITTVPEIEIVDEIYAEDGVSYSTRVGFRYKPVQTAHLQVSIDPLSAFTRVSGSGGYQYDETCLFGNTPYSRLFVIEPDVEPPVLNDAFALNSNTAVLMFNTNLDADSARDPLNYTITDGSGNPVPIGSVTLSPTYGSDDVPPDLTGPVGPEVTLETTSPLTSGTTYTVTVTNITEWGGNYTISNDNNRCEFSGYNGALTSVTGLSYSNQTYVGSTLETTYIKVVPIVFDLPVDTVDAESKLRLSIKASSGDPYVPVQREAIQWNSEETAAVLRISSGTHFRYIKLTITGNIQNKASGQPVYVGNYERTFSSYSNSFSIHCYNNPNSPDRINVTFYSYNDLTPANYDQVGNYSISHPSITSNLPEVTGVTLQTSDRATLLLSRGFPADSDYLLRVSGVHDPRLSALGLGSMTPDLTDMFRGYPNQ